MRNIVFLYILFSSPTHFVVGQPTVAKKQFHLYLLAGQSNMAGRGVVENEDKTTHPRVWMLNKSNQWELAAEPLHFDKPTVAGVGPGFAFAKEMAKMDTNIVIGLIPCAVGGSPIGVWEPKKYYEPTKTHPYDDAIRRTKIAMKKGILKGILWQQGESDSDSVKSGVYSTKLELLVKNFRKSLKIKYLPFVAGLIADFYIVNHPYANTINEAIEQLPNQTKHTAFVSSTALKHKGDDTHFDSPSARELGKRYAAVFQAFYIKRK
ncbi:sialate O-acetylesterase [Dyadobacter sp. CY345]|uniref:sialate O-acetylesterase n=1 Tax=Dyadobacter sp. CY345 TaxID=2909335 RepID=UPI001F4159EC|nr:sialate O-acetylesterase [Dyadobacter sp. CY345]MCF2446759.1 sialate O-acetylesterase [Dyadobacter sp. CY345]